MEVEAKRLKDEEDQKLLAQLKEEIDLSWEFNENPDYNYDSYLDQIRRKYP